ncbi:DUF1553 domain-containing protein [Fulvivirga sedimenti]|uniref:DUF1553 domain-containing protein n=1 Tax=Fulvivirga sedimenti TaxID=2879465 RepID=A0A9X1HR07_9BACT|nr:DUF1553 domain-containing protein [Fulvivirga sedimenti]MCA6075921.1 DUF1553 domain-containing protein [Fulvivirga sedimenti]MCA6077049.1 DUF1553 domain-containing protein [Fulvivirga sedimenti]
METSFSSLPEEIDFNLDVKPILSDRCYHCHGPDKNKRKGKLRLDTRDGLFEALENGEKAFVPGKLSRSAAIGRILHTDPELMMPPRESNRFLSDREKAILIKWVESGAQWKEHWAYISPEKANPPARISGWNANNEIDLFIQEKLKLRNLEPALQADKERLLRRVTLDLTGLPPTIEEQDAFLADSDENAYEKVVDRLLASKAYAERMTLEWLDVARYADSHGFHADGARTMWPWRDWVIEAFDQNMPYDTFVTEQLAGDLIPDAKREQIVATAFNRNHPMTAEGGVVDEEFRLEYVANRTNTLGTAFLGLTLECARCHDHKFDPITQKEYYQVSAFFNNMRELGMTGDDGDFGPMLPLPSSQTDSIIAYLNEEISSLETGQSSVSKTTKRQEPVLRQQLDKITPTDSTKFMDRNPNVYAQGPVELIDGVNGKAVLFNNQDARLYINNFGQFEAFEPFTVSAWVRADKETGKTKVIIGNAGEKNNLWRGWDVYLDSTNHLSFRLINTLPHNMIHVRSADTIKLGQWTQVLVSYDGSLKASGVKMGINGDQVKTNILYDRLYKNILPTNVSRTRDKRGVVLGKSYRSFTGDNGILKGSIDELAVYDFAVDPMEFKSIYESTRNGSVAGVTRRISQEERKLQELRKKKIYTLDTIPELMVMEEMEDKRPTFILTRGEYDKPTEKVQPATIDKVLPFDESYTRNRLGLSKWLFDRNNPLTARVAVNRYWQMIFGRGIVSTVNDFGSQGALPSHPTLLDWLAVDFIENGWDVKALLKKMVMSATYQQSSQDSRDKFEADPENIFLARGPSYRLQAEMIRDNALASSGLLNRKIGGPSAKPYQPDSLWIELGNFSHFLLYYRQDHDDQQYRRSMYTFIRRTSPPPNMIIFDATNREVCTVSRERTNTPLQALVLLNDQQYVEASKALAYRIRTMPNSEDVESQIENGFRLVLCRKPNRDELAVLTRLYESELNAFREDQQSVKELLAVGDFEIPDEWQNAELAALTLVSSTLYNMDESYMKR